MLQRLIYRYNHPMFDALMACFYILWWRFVLLFPDCPWETKNHARYRIYEERKVLKDFLGDSNGNSQK